MDKSCWDTWKLPTFFLGVNSALFPVVEDGNKWTKHTLQMLQNKAFCNFVWGRGRGWPQMKKMFWFKYKFYCLFESFIFAKLSQHLCPWLELWPISLLPLSLIKFNKILLVSSFISWWSSERVSGNFDEFQLTLTSLTLMLSAYFCYAISLEIVLIAMTISRCRCQTFPTGRSLISLSIVAWQKFCHAI